jgi:hypothetical protein
MKITRILGRYCIFFSSDGSMTPKDMFTITFLLETALLNLTSQSVTISALAVDDGFVPGCVSRNAAFS